MPLALCQRRPVRCRDRALLSQLLDLLRCVAQLAENVLGVASKRGRGACDRGRSAQLRRDTRMSYRPERFMPP